MTAKAKAAQRPKINLEKTVVLTLCASCVALIGLYMYFLSASIVHVVIQKEVNQDLTKLNSEIAELETAYINAQHHVSKQIASLDGYAEVTDKVFIDRTRDSLVLSEERP